MIARPGFQAEGNTICPKSSSGKADHPTDGLQEVRAQEKAQAFSPHHTCPNQHAGTPNHHRQTVTRVAGLDTVIPEPEGLLLKLGHHKLGQALRVKGGPKFFKVTVQPALTTSCAVACTVEGCTSFARLASRASAKDSQVETTLTTWVPSPPCPRVLRERFALLLYLLRLCSQSLSFSLQSSSSSSPSPLSCSWSYSVACMDRC